MRKHFDSASILLTQNGEILDKNYYVNNIKLLKAVQHDVNCILFIILK